MALDVARLLVLVPNGASSSAAMGVHETIGDTYPVAVNFSVPPLNIFSPASLNAGVFQLQVAWEDPLASPVWITLAGNIPGAGGLGQLPIILLGCVSWRIQATTPPNADTTFKVCKQFLSMGRMG